MKDKWFNVAMAALFTAFWGTEAARPGTPIIDAVGLGLWACLFGAIVATPRRD